MRRKAQALTCVFGGAAAVEAVAGFEGSVGGSPLPALAGVPDGGIVPADLVGSIPAPVSHLVGPEHVGEDGAVGVVLLTAHGVEI